MQDSGFFILSHPPKKMQEGLNFPDFMNGFRPQCMRSMLRERLIIFVMRRCCLAVKPVIRRGRILPVPVTKRERALGSIYSKSLGFRERAGGSEVSVFVDMRLEKTISGHKGKQFFQNKCGYRGNVLQTFGSRFDWVIKDCRNPSSGRGLENILTVHASCRFHGGCQRYCFTAILSRKTGVF